MGKAQVAQAAAPATPPPDSPKPAEPNLLSAKEGGQLIAAPSEGWQMATTGNDNDGVGFSCTQMPIDVIYAFKDERPATFAKFSILIPSAGKFVKDFELLAADDFPSGTYRSLGKFATQNMRLLKSPYQEFSFPETTAKYLKLRILSAYPSDCTQTLTQIRLIGKLGDQAAAPAPAASPDVVNLLAAAQGGQVIAAPGDGWQRATTGNDNEGVGFSCTQMPIDVIYAFKDERPGTFSKFSILIPSTGKFVKDFELLAADDSPSGTYRSLGKFATQNMRLVKSPYQEFSFPETTAKYLKLRILSAYPSDCTQTLTQIRVMGKPG